MTHDESNSNNKINQKNGIYKVIYTQIDSKFTNAESYRLE